MKRHHAHKGQHTGHPAPLGELEALCSAEQANLIITNAASKVSADDLMAIRLYPPKIRAVILSHSGHGLRSINSVAANGLACILQGNDPKRRASLVEALSACTLHGWGNHEELSTED